MSISTIIKKRRSKLGLTLAQVADMMGVSEATVQRWESGSIKNLRHERIGRLADVLRVSPAVLMGWEPLEQSGDGAPFLTLGHYVRNYREVHNVSVDQFSAASGLSSEEIETLELGVNESTGKVVSPTASMLKKVAKGTGEDMGDILSKISTDFLENDSNRSSRPPNYRVHQLRKASLPPDIPKDVFKRVSQILNLIGYDYDFSGISIVIDDGKRKSRPVKPEEYYACTKEIERYIKYVVDNLAWNESE